MDIEDERVPESGHLHALSEVLPMESGQIMPVHEGRLKAVVKPALPRVGPCLPIFRPRHWNCSSLLQWLFLFIIMLVARVGQPPAMACRMKLLVMSNELTTRCQKCTW